MDNPFNDLEIIVSELIAFLSSYNILYHTVTILNKKKIALVSVYLLYTKKIYEMV